MRSEDIKDIESLKELQSTTRKFKLLHRVWPIVKPLLRFFGMDTSKLDESIRAFPELAEQAEQLLIVPDKFNSLFAGRGWILFETMEIEAAEKAIELAEQEGLDVGDMFLVDHFSPTWVEDHLIRLKYIDGFQVRYDLAQLALADYAAGRYYSSALVTLTLIDGWVNDLNIVNNQRQGFFSDQAELVAWDSITAHPAGLEKLRETFSKPRRKTRTEEITIPYRHGILHGMDLGYNNRYVAAKCWAALFAVRDWAIKATKQELSPPILEIETKKTLPEAIEDLNRIRQESRKFREWQPRQVVVGKDIPSKGDIENYPDNTPERKLVEFLIYWSKNNYGFMAKCFSPMLEMHPKSVKENWSHIAILDFKLLETTDILPTVTDVLVEIKKAVDSQIQEADYKFRLLCTQSDGCTANFPSETTVWGVTTWG